ncbi:MAG: flagellar biosynthesis regulator FlaF [Bdellovibrionales bacterium]|jgi:flagellar protein FlaF
MPPRSPYEKVSVYGKTQKVESTPSGNSRDTDARALLACASSLNEVKELVKGDVKSRNKLKIYSEAIRKNQRLWTIFQVALTDPENPLPMPLKTTLLNLSQYVDKTSFRATGKYAPELIDSLININRIIAAGLSKQPSAESVQDAGSSAVSPRDGQTSLMTSA